MRILNSVALIAPLMAAAILPVSARTLYVPTQYPTIQSAVNAAHTGDTVQVSAKTGGDHAYHENVAVATSGVSLRAVGLVTLTGNGDSSNPFTNVGISVTGSNVTVSGFTIQNYAIGIYTQAVSPRILSNTLKANGIYGAYVDQGVATDLEQNTVTGNGAAVPTGVYIGAGIEIFGGNFTLRSNTITDNLSSGVFVETFTSASGSPIVPATIDHNTLSRNAGEGIFVTDSENLTISSNVITYSKRPDAFAPGDGLGNLGDGIGIFAGPSDHVTISYNQLIGNSLDGLYEDFFASNGSIAISYNAVLSNVADGIELAAGGNTVSFCVAVGNSAGPPPFGVPTYDAEDHTGSTVSSLANVWAHDLFGSTNPPGLGH